MRASISVVLSLVVWWVGSPAPAAGQAAPACRPDNAELKLPSGFCALILADSVGQARHVVVAPDGDVYVALGGNDGGVLALRDTNGDGVADLRERFGPGRGGSGIALRGDRLYFGTDDAIVRYRRPLGALRPAAPPDTIVKDLPGDRSHRAKTLAFGADGALYVNIGSPSNACQVEGRNRPGVPGQDPCAELENRAGIWRFDPDRLGQTQVDGRRWATGLRNTVAIAQNPVDGAVYGAVHGRDNLFQNWGKFYSEDESADLPSEIFVRIDEGDNYGWPYCYWDQNQRRYFLAPEYGGDKNNLGRCAGLKPPLLGFPGHWAPNGTLFYTGTQFPARYKNGVFVAFHGSWNRAPRPQEGYKVVFAPLPGNGGVPAFEVIADGFGGGVNSPQAAAHRPVGLAQGPDGSLFVTDDRGGRIYRILYRGTAR
ncbi:MAG: PQQ-dependent sugar dehydrogenase [Gemmatimonadetes bacterium]|nr:PQQ-dependent sugar dehydrogenase [Gemmatimonadota bacterium]